MTNENPYATPEAEITAPDDGSEELASLGARFGGAMIDGLIAIATIWPAMYLLGLFDRAMEGQQSIEDIVGGAVLGFALFLLINGYLLANRGQTVGKMLVKTRIVAVEDKKILPLWKLLLLRYFAGLTTDEAADVLGVSASSVDRRWRFVKAWLRREISGAVSDEDVRL